MELRSIPVTYAIHKQYSVAFYKCPVEGCDNARSAKHIGRLRIQGEIKKQSRNVLPAEMQQTRKTLPRKSEGN